MGRWIVFLLLPFFTLSAFASEELIDPAHKILLSIPLSDPNTTCPECGLGLTDLSKHMTDIQTKIEGLHRQIEDRRKSVGNDDARLTGEQLAANVRDHVSALQFEIDKQKMINRKAEIECTRAAGRNTGKLKGPPKRGEKVGLPN
jgi:hypothetical protein